MIRYSGPIVNRSGFIRNLVLSGVWVTCLKINFGLGLGRQNGSRAGWNSKISARADLYIPVQITGEQWTTGHHILRHNGTQHVTGEICSHTHILDRSGTKLNSSGEFKIKQRFWLVRYQLLMAVSSKMIVFWNVAPCRLVWIDRRFWGAYCLQHQASEILIFGNGGHVRPVCDTRNHVSHKSHALQIHYSSRHNKLHMLQGHVRTSTKDTSTSDLSPENGGVTFLRNVTTVRTSHLMNKWY
jgi:hypothetical protein